MGQLYRDTIYGQVRTSSNLARFRLLCQEEWTKPVFFWSSQHARPVLNNGKLSTVAHKSRLEKEMLAPLLLRHSTFPKTQLWCWPEQGHIWIKRQKLWQNNFKSIWFRCTYTASITCITPVFYLDCNTSQGLSQITILLVLEDSLVLSIFIFPFIIVFHPQPNQFRLCTMITTVLHNACAELLTVTAWKATQKKSSRLFVTFMRV